MPAPAHNRARCPAALGDAITWATAHLTTADIDTARLDAEVLAAYVLGEDRTFVVAHPEVKLSDREVWLYELAIGRRAERVPLPYLTGRAEFCSLPFIVTPQVLIPRPETEHLVETVEACVDFSGGRRIIGTEVGTGCGAVAIALAVRYPACIIYATDADIEALAVARRNITHHGVADRVVPLAGTLLAPLAGAGLAGQLDFIAANLPYIADEEWDDLPPEVRHEPRHAVIAGRDALALVRALIGEAGSYLAPNGWLCLEVGAGEAGRVVALLTDAGFRDPRVVRDLAGIERVVAARAASCDA